MPGKKGKHGRRLAGTGEEKIVRFLRGAFGSRARGVRLGIGDDTALIELPRGKRGLLATCDLMVEDVHFRLAAAPAEALGFKLLAVNVSDIAAMGGRSHYALLSFALPPDLEFSFVRRFAAGLKRAGRAFGVRIVGGDTTASRGGLFTSLALLGSLAGKRPLLRSAALPGDELYVTGDLGGAQLGLTALGRAPGVRSASGLKPVIRRHLWPKPPAEWGAALAEKGLCRAAMDLSDGLSTDLDRLCRESGVGADVYLDRIPIARAARRAAAALGVDPMDAALHGGEDYELLFCVSPRRAPEMQKLAGRMKVGITKIGSIRRGRRISQVRGDGGRAPLVPGGWRHF